MVNLDMHAAQHAAFRLREQMASGVPVGGKTSLVAWFNRHRRYRIGIKVQDQLKSVNQSAAWRDLVDHILEVRGVSLRFGGVRALSDVSFGVKQGELFSIIDERRRREDCSRDGPS